MMDRFYLLPIKKVDVYRGPKYLKWHFNPDGMDVRWSMKDYGVIDTACVAARVDQTQHDYLSGQSDVYSFPELLSDSPSPAELNVLETYLEGITIPANWLTPSNTWRQALRTVTGIFLFMQRFTAILGNPFELGITLNTKFSNLDTEVQDAIIQTFNDLGYDDSVIKSNWTMRVLMKNAADQWGDREIYFGFITL